MKSASTGRSRGKIVPAMKDKPGELVWINKKDLTVDHIYQRNLSEDKARKLAAEWSWVACGVLTVAWRQNDTWAVVEGQHRHAAAMLRDDITELPCLLFEEEEMGVAAEAESFITINTSRRSLHAAEVHKARVVSGDQWAVFVDKLVQSSGRTVSNYSAGNTVSCVSTLLACAKENAQVLTALWPVIVAVCDGHVISQRIVHGMFYLETNMLDGASLTEPRWKRRLKDVGAPAINDAINRFQAAYARGGARVWALGVQEAINKGLQNRLPVKASYAETKP